jgi:tRNA modification GTPase
MAIVGKEDRARERHEQIRFADSIVALSSGRLPAGVAVLRVSGPHARFVAEMIAGELPPERLAVLRTLRTAGGEPIDSGLVLFFPGPRSFTGEDVVEFHVHGGRASVAALLGRITELAGVRHAEPGEFTRRAFLNGKLDLTETEALADLIEAETEAQRRLAMRNAGGAQRELYLGWRRRLIHARAMIEAEIDFADEDDVPGSVADTVWSDVRALDDEIGRHVAGFHAAEIIRDGYDVVILGAPNAGKSSLFNALARREAAIVTEEPGTTRDLLEVALDIRGIKVRITDTAGLRQGGGRVEAIGIERARERAGEADLVLILEDMTAPAVVEAGVNAPVLRIGSKADLREPGRGGDYDLFVSSFTGEGIDALLDEIGERAARQLETAGDILPSRARHVALLGETQGYLAQALSGHDMELRAEDLRLAADRLGRIVGAVDVEDLLDVIFSQFCIGK